MEIYAEKIPIQERPDVRAVAERVERNKLRANRDDLEYLFTVYHTYLAPFDNQNIECRACRAKVCGIFFSILRVWRTTKQS